MEAAFMDSSTEDCLLHYLEKGTFSEVTDLDSSEWREMPQANLTNGSKDPETSTAVKSHIVHDHVSFYCMETMVFVITFLLLLKAYDSAAFVDALVAFNDLKLAFTDSGQAECPTEKGKANSKIETENKTEVIC